MLSDLAGHDLLGQPGAGVVHRQDDGADFEVWLRLVCTRPTLRSSWPEALEGVVLALDRHQDLVGGGQSVDREQPQRRRTVDEDEVEVVLDGLEGSAQASAPG